jgi:hypothetical protein
MFLLESLRGLSLTITLIREFECPSTSFAFEHSFFFYRLKKREGELSKYVSEIARCSECGAYVNPFCDINSLRWFCAICTRRNNYSKAHIRYRHIDPKLVPELKNALVDLDLPLYDNTNVYQVPALKRPLIHLLLVQETMQIDTLEAVRNVFFQFFLYFLTKFCDRRLILFAPAYLKSIQIFILFY